MLVISDRRRNENFSSRGVVFALSAIGIAGKLAIADGPINLMEVSGFLKIFKIPEEQKKHSVQLFFSAAKDNEPTPILCDFIKKCYPDSDALKAELVGKLIKVADADQFIQHKEYELISEVASQMNIGEAFVQEVLWRYYTAVTNPLTSLLKLPKKPSEADIKNSFRKISRELHPDVYEDGGFSFLNQLASVRFSAVSGAYKKLVS